VADVPGGIPAGPAPGVGQTAEGVSAVEKVQTALVDQDKVLQRAREDLAKARTLAAEWETKVASVCA
jgi:hypothetical protein